MKYDLVIIGGGAAGMMAGVYAGRKKINVVILTKNVGGQALLTNIIENFPAVLKTTGAELAASMRKQAEQCGAIIKDGEEIEKIEKTEDTFLVKTKNNLLFQTKAIIIATGKTQRRLGIPGESEFKNKGVVFCSVCDAPLFGGKNVAVIGGGNSGFESALDLIRYAAKIYIIGANEKMRGDAILREKLEQSGKVEFINNAELKEIKGNKFVEKIVYLDKKTRENKELAVGGVFINIGWVPATDFLDDLVKLNKNGEIEIDQKTMETSVKGIFAAGDATDVKYKQLVVACADGAKAALAAYEYLSLK